MNNQELKTSEGFISKQFDKESKGFDERDTKGLGKTAEEHIKQITSNSGVKTAIDVGSGTGGIMVGLLENDLDFVYGVDLAPSMINLARKRLEDKGFADKSKIENISFLDYTFEKSLDAVSLHRVLCCHPDRQAMIEKTLSTKPKIIVLTIPRRRLLIRGAISLLNIIRKLKKGFRPYLHDIKKIDLQLLESNYKLIDTFKTFMWVTRTYKLQDKNTQFN